MGEIAGPIKESACNFKNREKLCVKKIEQLRNRVISRSRGNERKSRRESRDDLM